MKRKSLKSPWLVTYIARHFQALKTSILQLKQSRISTFITCLVIGIALALPMGMLILLKNVRLATNNLQTTSHISIYLKNDISKNQQKKLLELLHKDQAITQINYISPKQGLMSFQKQLGLHENFFADFKQNPLPGVIVVQPTLSNQNSLQMSQLVDRLKNLSNVDQVQLNMAWLQRLNAILMLIHRFIFAIMLLFAFGVVLIVSHTIQLITENRRDEITIIKLLGASNSFVRRPFLYAGLLYGLLGSITAWILIELIILILKGPVEQLASFYSSNFVLKGLDLHFGLTLMLLGSLLGYFGSWLAVGRHINAVESNVN